jgi:hypothetical protein
MPQMPKLFRVVLVFRVLTIKSRYLDSYKALATMSRRKCAPSKWIFYAAFRPDRDNWKLASHIVAGFPHENKIRPERTLENDRYSVVAPRRKYISNPKPATL